MKDIQYIILRSKQIKKNTIIYEVRKIESGEVKWIYKEDIDEKYVSIEEYIKQKRDEAIKKIID